MNWSSKKMYVNDIKYILKRLIIWALFFYISLNDLYAQNVTKFIYLDDITYEYFDYLINSGKHQPKFVFHQPYKINDLKNKSSSKKGKYFTRYWENYFTKYKLSGQLMLADNLRYHNAIYNRYFAQGSIHFISKYITLANRTTVNQDYKVDPLYAGDLSESKSWIYGRVNDAYINLNLYGFDLFFGRMDRNWGPVNSPGVLLSNNPYTYDHFLFSYKYDFLKFSLIFAQLENLDALYKIQPESEIISVSNARKFLVGHRLDLRFSNNFQIGLAEMATYGGEGRDIELSLLNPMTFFYGVQRNDKKQLDGFWALDVFYKPVSELSFYGQFLIDDIIVNNDPGVDDRARFPDRLGITMSARSADVLLNGLNSGITYSRIWNRTYQSKFTWENYHYRELGLGYPCASCEEVKLKLGYWDLFPFYLQNELIIGRYGNVLITDLFPQTKEDFPIKPVTNNIVNHFLLKYFFNTNLQFELKLKYVKDRNHYSNRIDNIEGLLISVGIGYLLSGGIDFN